jgi:hypothetical protein
MKNKLTIPLHTKPPINYPRFSRRWNERLIHAGVGASLIESVDNYDES